jgi:hypothetical protein
MQLLRKYGFDTFLFALSLLSSVLMLVASTDPVVPSISGTAANELLMQFQTGNQIVFDLSVGVLASIFIYYLVVRIPEYQKRRRLRANLATTYLSFKEDSIAIYLGCIMGSYPSGLPRRLSDQVEFRSFFKEQHTHDQDRWQAVANGLNDDRLKTLLIELDILAQEIHFTLSATDVQDQRAFQFLKRLTHIIHRGKNWTSDYDDVKSLMGFLWSLHTGWSWIDGYPDSDPVVAVIDSI